MNVYIHKILNLNRGYKQLILVSSDLFLSILSTWIAYSLRISEIHIPSGIEFIPYILASILFLFSFYFFKIYRIILRYGGVNAIQTILFANISYGIIFFLILDYLTLYNVPRSIAIWQPMMFLLILALNRSIFILLISYFREVDGRNNIMIYGSGDVAFKTASTLSLFPKNRIIGFIDESLANKGKKILGSTIYNKNQVSKIIKLNKVNQIIIAVDNISINEKNKVFESLQKYQVSIKTLNLTSEKFSNEINVDDIQDLEISDIIGGKYEYKREILLDKINGNIVLITGAGGSIGSELSRQILLARPKELVLVDHSEFNLFNIVNDINDLCSKNNVKIKIKPYLSSISDRNRIKTIFLNHRPNQVFHAAAYKHVGLVEENIIDGFTNNVMGTMNVIDAAMKTDSVNNFVLISTDKAVRPTNIMGKTKRLAEIFLQLCASENTKVKFSIVRFGNVFNSSGSVIPIFKKQISRGGPVTVTDKNATRYFMSIPEATELILEANDKACGGEIFVLDMGNPVKIIDIAKKMIALSGLKVKFNNLDEGDILIKITGLKSGEKLHEELFIGENIIKTDNKKILIAKEPFLERKNFEHLMKLSSLAINGNSEEKLIDLLNDYV
jgi:FlaA1/EpsC-like NDP-sugar epimerase